MSAAIDYGYLPDGKYFINHDIMHCTAEGVVGNHLYSGRALGISQPWDVIQLHPDLKPLWQDIQAHYQRIGLPHSAQVIWNLDLRHLRKYTGLRPSVFYFGAQQCRNWGDYEWLETVEYINSKNNFMDLARQLGMDIPDTRCFDRVADIAAGDIEQCRFPCYLKAAVSVSGVGIFRCADAAELRDAIQQFQPGVPVQIQEEVRAEKFLNMQYQIVGDQVIRLAASEQILDGFAHQGNRYPASHQPWASVEPMAYWLKAHGIKGIFAFDVAVVQTSQGLRFPVIECNPRYNGASYPTLIANKLYIREWSAINFSTRHRSLRDVDLSGLEFDANSGRGVIIVNWGTVLEGKLVLLLAGDGATRQRLKLELETRLC
jgi:hypothetical protein